MDLTALSTGLGTIKTDMLSAIVAVAPVALAVVGAILVWKFGIKFFKGLAK